MERKKPNKESLSANENIRIPQVLSELVSRAILMSKLGYSYNSNRDLYEALGYKLTLTYEDFAAQYQRQDIAGAIVDKPIEATWKDGFTIFETDKKDTALETGWNVLEEQFKLCAKFERLDKVSSIGKYGVLLLGLDDTKKREDMATPVVGKRKLLYVKPLGEGSAEIKTYQRDNGDRRYGLPVLYNIVVANPGEYTSTALVVHHTRIIHVARNLTESEVEGRPQLQRVFNRLKDLEKLVGGSAEMFWRGARPGYQGTVDADYMIDDTQRAALQTQIDEYEHNLRRILVNEGLKLEALTPQVSSPKDHVDIQIQMISAETGIPKRILTGSERGELSSQQDMNSWRELIEEYRTKHAEPHIVRAFIDRCIEYGILSKAGAEGYKVIWPDLWTPSEKEKAEVGKTRAEALAAYEKFGTSKDTVPVEAFFKYFLGLEEADVDYLVNLRDEYLKTVISEEDKTFEDEDEDEDEEDN